MCQALWSSPLLPLSATLSSSSPDTAVPPFGTSGRFRRDLLSYLKAYGSKTGELVKELKKYDFSSVRAALIASVPSKQLMHGLDPDETTTWGWPALRHVLTSVPSAKSTEASIVIQISSIATLGATSSYLDRTFFPAISSSSTPSTSKPSYSIIFPTAASIRRSLDGYASGASIHTKIQSVAQGKQLAYLKPYLHHWEIPSDDRLAASTTPDQSTLREAGRKNAAPHIKTYIRFKDETMESIDWAMVTSANLSTQAWGAAPNTEGIVRISSFEIGVVIWPELFSAEGDPPGEAEMVPVFGKNEPDPIKDTEDGQEKVKTRIGFRMPYDLPLVRYGRDDEPWCATKDYTEPDWRGGVWSVSGH
jgi:tyrosyl-DNA phosphodiesterase 1